MCANDIADNGQNCDEAEQKSSSQSEIRRHFYGLHRLKSDDIQNNKSSII